MFNIRGGGGGGGKERQMCKPFLCEQVIIVKSSDLSAYYLCVISVGTADGPLSLLQYIGLSWLFDCIMMPTMFN